MRVVLEIKIIFLFLVQDKEIPPQTEIPWQREMYALLPLERKREVSEIFLSLLLLSCLQLKIILVPKWYILG